MTITFDEFIQRYNEVYHENRRCLFTNTLEIDSIIEKLYDTIEFDINEETETIELY
jgi:hypothetical protein